MFWLLVSVGAHLAFITLVWLIIIILSFFGLSIPLFNMAEHPRDVEFVLVDNSPKQAPRHPTKNRAEHATRSGGQKIANMPTQMSQRAAGRPAAKSVPRPAQQPQPRPQPTPQPSHQASHQPAARPAPQAQPKAAQQPTPHPSQAPAPPAPKLPRPTKVASAAPSMPPNPIAPTIRTPAPPNPSMTGGGPVVKTPGGTQGASGSSGGGNPGPSMIAGHPTRGGSGGGSPGGGPRGGGSAGTGAYNQTGSPGGGGGRAGIDAQEEPDFGPYVAELQRRIRRNWSPPVEDRSKRVVVLFHISRDGRLLGLQIMQSSGSPPADQAAIAAVRASAPFRALPPGFRGNDIAVQFIFDYEIQGGGSARMR